MILLGYHSTGGYKLFDPRSKQIIISRDVVFDESRSWNWEPIENFLDIPLSLTLYFDDPDEINYVGPTRLQSPLQ